MGEMDWVEQAACKGRSELFDILDKDRYPNMSRVKLKYLNNSNFLKAKAICDTCPVIKECQASATAEDREFTFRAGNPPTGYTFRNYGRPSKGGRPRNAFCSQGHDSWNDRPDGSRYCTTCESFRKRLVARQEGVRPKGKRNMCKRGHIAIVTGSTGRRYCKTCRDEREEKRRRDMGQKPRGPRETCRKGHNEWGEKASGRYCIPCNRERDRQYWQKKKAAKMSA